MNEKLLSIQKAINLLNSMPEKYKVENSEIAYSDEVAFLMNFFRIVYSTLFLRKFSNVGVGSKDFDPSQLDTMTDEEAEAVVNQLRAAAQASAASQNPAMQEKIDKALSDYDNASGSSKDKLKELLKPKTGS